MHPTIQWLDVTDSTQNVLLGGIHDHDNMSVVAAGIQTAGRGQRGNSWLAGKWENLTFSLLLKPGTSGMPALRTSDQFILSEAASLGVASYLESKGIGCSIKWPNDIYVRNRKVCGMLIENVLEGEYIAASVLGVGLNVNQVAFPPQLINPVSMRLVTGTVYDIKAELEVLAEASLAPGGREVTRKAYLGRLYRLGEFHEYVRCSDGSTFEARIVGTTDFGRLIMENRKGEQEEFAFKEISYII